MRQFVVGIVVAMMLFSCSGTKHLPKDDYLYVGTRGMRLEKVPPKGWSIKQSSIKKTTAYWAVWDLPNAAAMGFPAYRLIPTRLIFYNWFYTDKSKGFSHWMMNNFGEPPVLLSSINPELKTKKVVNIFENFGHFGTTGSYNIKYHKRKAVVYYHFRIPKAYTYRTIDHVYDSAGHPIAPYIARYRAKTLLHPGDEFNLDVLRAEKLAFWTYLQNSGYYFIRQADITVLADTTAGNKQMDMEIGIDRDLPGVYFSQQSIAKRTILIDTVRQNEAPDKYYRWSAGKIKRKLFDSLAQLTPGRPYALAKVRETIRNLSDIGIFTNPQISFTPARDSLTLDATIAARTADATIFGANAKSAYRATGYIGPSLGVTLTQLNVFNGAENLFVELDGYYYFPLGVFKERISNSSGISLRSTLSAPMISSPFNFIKHTYALPKKNIIFNAELNDRKDYFTMHSFSLGYAFTWKSSPKISHRLSPIEVTFSDIVNATPLFDSLVIRNPSLRNSLVDQFILGSFYSFKYDNLSTADKRVGTYFEGRLELAGNTLYLLSRLTKGSQGEGENRGVFGLDYSQFVEVSYDFRTHIRVSNRSELAFRHIGGIGVAYGNSEQLPYIRQFFIGGSNSLRPINARTAGPGRYIELNEGEVNQVGDLKLEWNLEYRVKLNARLSAALWSDAGNIWLLREDPNRPFAQVRWNRIFEDSYLTAGVGLRLDVNFLVLRVDYGAILYAPIFIDGYKWLWENKLPLWGPVIGFGLPF